MLRWKSHARSAGLTGAKMNSPAVILEILAVSAARSLELYDLAKAELVDPLQEFAEKTGLVELIGQDAVQAIISAPFTHCGDSADFPLVPDDELPGNDYAARIIQKWEMADSRDRWRHTGELPPSPSETFAPAPKSKYQPPQATVDAFFHVARNESAEFLAAWFAERPLDAPFLLDLAEAKCPSN